MVFKILVTDKLSSQAMELLDAAADAVYEEVHRPSPEDLLEIIPNFDAIIIRSSTQVDA
jgi:D-3-phosphoglycerate dehydrogenase